MEAQIHQIKSVLAEDNAKHLIPGKLALEVMECLNVRNIIITKSASITVQMEKALEDDSKEKVDNLIRKLFLKEKGIRKTRIGKAICMCMEHGKMTKEEALIFLIEATILELFGNSYTKELRKGIKKRWGVK